MVYSIIIRNDAVQYNIHAHNLGTMFGIFKNDGGRLVIFNKIFEIVLYNYLIAKEQMRESGKKLNNYTSKGLFENKDGTLDMKSALLKYQEYMRSVYNNYDKEFIERQGRLLLLAFFKPIINGQGFYFVESHTGFEQRQDVVITFGNQKYIIELKIWRGIQYHKKGIKQLESYLDCEKINKGYMVVFNKNDSEVYDSEVIKSGNREIFVVWI